MLEVKNLYKNFDDNSILESINLSFEEKKIYGILGTNGAGKSTLLRTIAGIYKPNDGRIVLNGNDVFENIDAKAQIFYIPDENIYLPRRNIVKCLAFYKSIYNSFDQEIFDSLQELFNLNLEKDIKSFSKGQKKQAILLLTLSFNPSYVILDETFDGLDPLVRIKVKKYLIELAESKNICLIVSTHSIGDIENLADEIIVINDKTVSFKKNQQKESNKFLKVQLCFNDDVDLNELPLSIKKSTTVGSVTTVIFENSIEEITDIIKPLNPLVFDISPLTLEEIFMFEVEGF